MGVGGTDQRSLRRTPLITLVVLCMIGGIDKVDLKLTIRVIAGNRFSPFYDEHQNIYYVNEYELFDDEILRMFFDSKNADFAGNSAKSAHVEIKGIERGKRKRKLSDVDIANVFKLLESGVSKRKIAKIYNCDEKTIRNVAKREIQFYTGVIKLNKKNRGTQTAIRETPSGLGVKDTLNRLQSIITVIV